jgi:pyruvate dehydrogenase E2 component (dihydrolipoamide acetyltransferase)
VGGGLFAYRRGEGDRTVVLLHGFGATHRIWAPVQAELSATATTVAFDLPGHGRSPMAGSGGPARLAAEAVLRAIEEDGRTAVHLVGHSMGGAAAALAALAAPGLVASLTLLAPGGFGPEINHRLLSRYARARTREALAQALEGMSGWNNAVPDPVLEDHVTMRAAAGQTEALSAILSRIVRDGVQGTIGRDGLERLSMPVKVLWGTQDRVLPTRQAHRLPSMFAVHVFEETGHMLQCERPGEVARLIRENIR